MDVMRLPEKLKQVVLLHYFQDLTLREVAEVLGVAPFHGASQAETSGRTIENRSHRRERR
ncbi:MAG: sigma factor-like helix-turn-helix DNA-binding protein [Christensenellales bacterium]